MADATKSNIWGLKSGTTQMCTDLEKSSFLKYQHFIIFIFEYWKVPSDRYLFPKWAEVYFILYLMKFKYVPLPAQHFLMVNWDSCLVLLACFWDLEGPRVFRRVCVSLFLFIKKTYPLWHNTLHRTFQILDIPKCWAVSGTYLNFIMYRMK